MTTLSKTTTIKTGDTIKLKTNSGINEFLVKKIAANGIVIQDIKTGDMYCPRMSYIAENMV